MQAKTTSDGNSEDNASLKSDENSKDSALKNGEGDSCTGGGNTINIEDSCDQESDGNLVETVKEKGVDDSENNQTISKPDGVNTSADQVN